MTSFQFGLRFKSEWTEICRTPSLTFCSFLPLLWYFFFIKSEFICSLFFLSLSLLDIADEEEEICGKEEKKHKQKLEDKGKRVRIESGRNRKKKWIDNYRLRPNRRIRGKRVVDRRKKKPTGKKKEL